MTTKEYGIGQYIVNEIHLYDTKLKDDNSAPSASSIDGVPSFNSQSSSFNNKDTTSSPNMQGEDMKFSISESSAQFSTTKAGEIAEQMRLTWNNERKNWLLTAFEKKETVPSTIRQALAKPL